MSVSLNKVTEKLQKILSARGLGSRRELETWISAGRVKVNGVTAKLGDRATDNDKISVDNQLILASPKSAEIEVLLYYKPEGKICSKKDPEGRASVFDHLPKPKSGRWIMVGRLDLNTSGLLLFTNNGELANQLMHPRHEIEREYAVRIMGKLTEAQMGELQKGVHLEDGMARFTKITYQGGENANHWYHVVLKEGRNREIRRIFESINIMVSRLIRIRFGSLALPQNLSRGKFILLDKATIKKLSTTNKTSRAPASKGLK
jgi:23S rRNA pseudouridine2605 synthase